MSLLPFFSSSLLPFILFPNPRAPTHVIDPRGAATRVRPARALRGGARSEGTRVRGRSARPASRRPRGERSVPGADCVESRTVAPRGSCTPSSLLDPSFIFQPTLKGVPSLLCSCSLIKYFSVHLFTLFFFVSCQLPSQRFVTISPFLLLSCSYYVFLPRSLHQLQVRVAVDLVAGTHMLNRDWDLAAHLYLSVADEMRESGLEAKQVLGVLLKCQMHTIRLARTSVCNFDGVLMVAYPPRKIK